MEKPLLIHDMHAHLENFDFWASSLGGNWQANQVSALSHTWYELSFVTESAETCFLAG